MSHQTFAIITIQVKSEDEFLFLVKDSKISQVYSWENRAIGGSHRQEDFRKQFCSDFAISEDDFEQFQKENIPLNKTDRSGEKSISLLKLTVTEVFYAKTKKDTEHYKWIAKSSVENLIAEEEGFAAEGKWVFIYLFRDLLDFAKLPPALSEVLKTIQEAREKRKLVIFAGAGISFDSGAPLWKETSTGIMQAIGLESTCADATLIGQWLHNEKDEKEYNEKLRQILGYYKNLQPNPIHHQILRLRPRHVVTTNFDDLLEKAMNEHQQAYLGATYTVIKKDKELPYAVNDEYLIKMHGDWEEMNFVFKEDDYLNYSQNFPLIESFVKGVFSSHLVLFIGFSFSDSNLKQIVNWVKRILGEDFQRAYLFQHDDEIAPHQDMYFRKKGILPIAYDSSITKLLTEIEPPKRSCDFERARPKDLQLPSDV